ncbi:MAG: PQQ-dependent sugar dehydrogenase, partial [Rhodothermia bacterium]|nr:PQQ-dependent sugar dehydrogenase [Rhodothermia bacterium]
RDEWYDYRYVNPNVNVLLTVDEKSYKRPNEKPTSDAHPIAWFHEYDGGRSFYTGLGHTIESFAEPLYRRHLLGGIRYAMGDDDPLNYRDDGVRPLPTQFRKVILEDNLNEPMELDLLPDGRVIYIERHGRVRIHDPKQGAIETAAKLTVTTLGEDGLLGIAVDPNHARNRWVYLYYSPADDPPRQRLSRFELAGSHITTSTEIVMLEIPTQRADPKPGCCHSGGSLEFDASGNLYLSTGDNTNPFESNGFAPVDERPERAIFDAQRTAANTADFRGKILRIRPTPDGSYSIPDGNLFPADGSRGRPEIYIMGSRNPFRMSVDDHSGDLVWGDVGPDAGRDSTVGPRGYDEVNRASAAGNYGWPYAIADNQVYADYDFTIGASERRFDCVDPENDSPNNSGARRLPPCRPAWIWYSYDKSDHFPLLGSGGRTAMAGPVYRHKAGTSPPGLPKYYDGKLFIYEWMRGWIAVVDIDSPGWPPVMQSYMPDTEFSRPMDMVIDRNGVLYLLEYGTEWEAQNPDARLTRIEYRAAEDAYVEESESRLAAAEASGQLGLSKPHAEKERGHLTSSTSAGEDMVRASDCMACHRVDEPSIGPSFVAISDRYRDQDDVLSMLAAKVRTGGSGVWGSQPMVPHPQHSADEIEAMVAYILSLRSTAD